MPLFERGAVKIHYEEYGSGYPVLLIAPGGMRSAIELWSHVPFNPVTALADEFRVVAMDQRNAGSSYAPITASDNWMSFTNDQLALMDHLGHARFHAVGCCIGCSHILSLAQAAPARLTAGGLLQPIGFGPDGIKVFHGSFGGWAQEFLPRRTEVEPAVLQAFRDNLYCNDFVFSVSRDFVRGCAMPMLIMAGNDTFHPMATAREIAALAPHAELIETWKTPETAPAALGRLRAFLKAHRPPTG